MSAAHKAAATLAPWVHDEGAWLIVDRGLVVVRVWGEPSRWAIEDPTVLVGRRLGEVFGEDVAKDNEQIYTAVLDGVTVSWRATVGGSDFEAQGAPVVGADGAVVAALVVFRRAGRR